MRKTITKIFLSRASKKIAAIALLLATLSANAQEYFQRLSMEGVELIGAVTWGKVDQFTLMSPGYYEFSYDRKFSPDKTAPIFKTNPMGGCAYHDGKIYSCEYSTFSHKTKPVWRVYDAKTFQVLSEHELKDNCESTTTCITYDQTSDCLYGLLETYDETFLVKIDPETGDMTRVGSMLDHISYTKYLAIACSPSGTIYCTYLNKSNDAISLGKFRKSTGQVSLVRGISATNLLPGDSFINGAYEQAMFFNNATGKMYWMFQGSSAMLYKEVTQIYEVNPTTADAVMVAYTEDQLQGPGAFFLEPSLDAPAIISGFCWKADGEGSQNGTVEFTMPTETYGAKPLTGELKYTVNVNDNETINGTAAPGEKVTLTMDDMPNKWNELKINVTNAAGEGPTVKRTFFAGYDTPNAPYNVKLTDEGLTTTLTWQAPEKGVNGEDINNADLTYTVVRYPGEETVAEGLKDCKFSETHPEEMTRYVYTVAATANGKTSRTSMSNNVVVGKPLNVPYSCTFDDAYAMYNYFTILDNNNDNYTWMYDSDTKRAAYRYSMENEADDWLISPPINYEKGKTYELSFRAMSSSLSYKEDMEVTFGSGKTIDEQTTTLLDLNQIPAQNEEGAQNPYQTRFTVDEDGVYYFAFHAKSEKFREYIYLWDISVKETDATSIIGTISGNDFLLQTNNGSVLVNTKSGTPINVFDMGGRKLAQCTDGTLSAKVGKGAYIVKIGDKTIKAIVK